MTKPLDTGTMSEEMLVRQLRRRLAPDDRRGRDLIYELRWRLWVKTIEADKFSGAVSDLGKEVGRVAAVVHEAAEALGVPKRRPALRLVEPHDA
jgi:hypothetical protein